MALRNTRASASEASLIGSAQPAGGDLRLARLLVDLVESLVEERDLGPLLDRATHGLADLLPSAETGVLLLNERGELSLVSSSDESAELLELLQLQRSSGPCLEVVRGSGHAVMVDLTLPGLPWPEFVAGATSLGFRGVLAIPMRAGKEVVGCVNVFMRETEEFGRSALECAHAVVEATAAALSTQRRLDEVTTLADQLSRALHSRVAIEQAKGILAGHAGIGVDEAFDRLRQCARRHRLELHVLAADVAARSVTPDDVLTDRPGRRPGPQSGLSRAGPAWPAPGTRGGRR